MTKFTIAAEKLYDYIDKNSQYRTIYHPTKIEVVPYEFLTPLGISGDGDDLENLFNDPKKFSFLFDLLSDEIQLQANKYNNCIKPSEGGIISPKDRATYESARSAVISLKEIITLINEIIEIYNQSPESSLEYSLIDSKPLDDALSGEAERPAHERKNLIKEPAMKTLLLRHLGFTNMMKKEELDLGGGWRSLLIRNLKREKE